jgi:hypothetical protein
MLWHWHIMTDAYYTVPFLRDHFNKEQCFPQESNYMSTDRNKEDHATAVIKAGLKT